MLFLKESGGRVSTTKVKDLNLLENWGPDESHNFS